MKCPDIRQQVTQVKIHIILKTDNGRYNEGSGERNIYLLYPTLTLGDTVLSCH